MAFTEWELEDRERRRYQIIYQANDLDYGGEKRSYKESRNTPGEREAPEFLKGLALMVEAMRQLQNPPIL